MTAYAPGEIDRMADEDREFWAGQRALAAQGIWTGNLPSSTSPWVGAFAENASQARQERVFANVDARQRF